MAKYNALVTIVGMVKMTTETAENNKDSNNSSSKR